MIGAAAATGAVAATGAAVGVPAACGTLGAKGDDAVRCEGVAALGRAAARRSSLAVGCFSEAATEARALMPRCLEAFSTAAAGRLLCPLEHTARCADPLAPPSGTPAPAFTPACTPAGRCACFARSCLRWCTACNRAAASSRCGACSCCPLLCCFRCWTCPCTCPCTTTTSASTGSGRKASAAMAATDEGTKRPENKDGQDEGPPPLLAAAAVLTGRTRPLTRPCTSSKRPPWSEVRASADWYAALCASC